MKMHNLLGKLYVVALFMVVFFIISIHAGRFLGYEFYPNLNSEIQKRAFNLEEADKLLPGASLIRFQSDDEGRVFDKYGRKLGTLLHTQPTASHITGYGSTLPIVIGLNKENKVTGLLLQKNGETPGFVKRLEEVGLFASWNGQNASDAIDLPVDAISRATMTSRATIDSVRLRLAKFMALEQTRKQTDIRYIFTEALARVFLLVSFLGCFASSKFAKYRKVFLLVAIVLPGFVLGRFFSIDLLYTWVINGIPLRNQLFLVIVVFLAVLVPLLSGRSWYCMWYCPYGAAQELLGYACRKKIDFTGSTGKLLRYIRPTFLAIIVLLLLVGYKFSLHSIEPFSAFLLSSASTTAIILAVIFLVLAIFIRRPWCNYFCPSGQIVEMLRVGLVDQTKRLDGKEAREVKIHAVLNVLLAFVIIILLMSPAKIGNNGVSRNGKVKDVEVDMTATNTVNVSQQSRQEVTETVNPALANIFARKSVRSFTGGELSRENLTELVKAGMAAPTARNIQPWQFIVVTDRHFLDALAARLPYAKMLGSASAAIIVCGDLNIAKAGGSEAMWMLDCSAATQNILLAAESMQLGAVWTAAYPYDDRIAVVNDVLRLPEYLVPLCVIPVGQPDGNDKAKNKWKPERLHWNSFMPASSSAELAK